MADNPVAKFRRVFEAGLKSGKYFDGPAIDVVQAVKALATRTQLVDALDVYVALFDPEKPPQSRDTFELGRSAGYNIFGRALELASLQNDLLELVQSLPSQSNPQLKDPHLAQRLPLYRKRYEALSANDKGDLQRRAKSLAGDRAAEAARRGYLLDDLEKEFRNKKGHPPAPGELLSFNEWPLDAHSEFERLAIACEAALFPKTSGIAGVWVYGLFLRGAKAASPANGASVAANAQSAFKAFGQFLEQQIKQPLDLFRLLAWAREPSSRLYTKYETRGGDPTFREPTSLWGGVWPELYQDIVARGLFVALTAWNIPQMKAHHGYVGKDLDFILAPLDEQWKEIFRRRLQQAFKPREFADVQTARRRAAAWGDAKGLRLVDEVESERELKELVVQFDADPIGVLSRTVYLSAQQEVYKRTIHLFQAEEDVFTVVWIPKQRGKGAYINVHALPGFLFHAPATGVGLKELIEDKVYADLAANAAALTEFLLACLFAAGLLLDVITAGASGGLRVVLFRFIEMRLKDMFASRLLEVTGIENPYVKFIVGMAAGMTPSAIHVPKFKGLEELEHEAQNVLVWGGKFKPKPEPGVGDSHIPSDRRSGTPNSAIEYGAERLPVSSSSAPSPSAPPPLATVPQNPPATMSPRPQAVPLTQAEEAAMRENTLVMADYRREEEILLRNDVIANDNSMVLQKEMVINASSRSNVRPPSGAPGRYSVRRREPISQMRRDRPHKLGEAHLDEPLTDAERGLQAERQERFHSGLEQEMSTGLGRSVVDKPGGSRIRIETETGQLVHQLNQVPSRTPTHYAEALRNQIGNPSIPPRFDAHVNSGEIMPLANLPNDLLAEVVLGVTSRTDRIARIGGIIYDLKPNTVGSIKKGLKRMKEYVSLANKMKFDGRTDWRGVIVVYDAAKARQYIPPQ
jgi:hypothetical protein